MKKKMIYLVFLLTAHLMIFADVPNEKFFIIKANLPNDYLKKAVGIVTISSGIKRNINIPIYDDDFLKTGTLNLRDNSQPISNFGYHPPNDTLISNFRYLVIDENDEFLKIVYAHSENNCAWISKIQLNERFYFKIKYLDYLKTGYGEFLSLFKLTSTDIRKIHKHPSDNSNSEFIKKEDYSDKLVKILEQKNEFLRIAVVEEDCDNKIEIVKELGWLKIKNEEGSLNVWIVMKDLC